MEIYQKLFEYFGPQHWWPAETSFEMIIGAILTQNVSWGSAAAAIENLKEAGILSISGILSCREEELAALVRPARYHFQKAKRLQAFCKEVEKGWGGDLAAFLSQEWRSLRRRLLSMYGIGPETADAIILYAAEQPVFVIDAYTHRIFRRLGFFPEKISYEKMQRFFMEQLPPEVPLYNEYHAQIDALGHHLCHKQHPRCGACPLSGLCPTAQGTREGPGRKRVKVEGA